MAKVRSYPVSIDSGHPDYAQLRTIKDAILKYAGGEARLKEELPALLQDAIDFVIDPARTARNRVSELDNVEKTFIGLKVEHFIRDFLNVPKGVRDLEIDGIDVDIKNTVSNTWMIPPETFRTEEPCLLIAIADDDRRFWLGLVLARSSYLGTLKGNRDSKRNIVKKGKESILWIISGDSLPPSRFDGINMSRFRELRKINPGKARAATYFRENLGRVTHRHVLQSLLPEQLDFPKRLRGNGGARDILRAEGIVLLSGSYNRPLRAKYGFGSLARDEFVAIQLTKDE